MSIFGFSERKARLNWNQLESVAQLEEFFSAQDGVIRVFFKHSTRCSISSMALNSFESNWEGEEENLYFVDLLRFREVSNALAEQAKVIHQSPQAIVVRNGEVLYDASHSGIDAKTIYKIIAQA